MTNGHILELNSLHIYVDHHTHTHTRIHIHIYTHTLSTVSVGRSRTAAGRPSVYHTGPKQAFQLCFSADQIICDRYEAALSVFHHQQYKKVSSYEGKM